MAEQRAKQKKWISETKQVWANRVFVPTRNNPELEGKIAILLENEKLETSASPGLSNEQVNQAKLAIRLFFHAYASQDFSEYMKFRVPVDDFTVSRDRIAWIRNYFQKFRGAKSEDLDISELALLEKFWDSDILGAKGYFGDIDIQTLTILTSPQASRITPEDFKRVTTFITAGFQGYHPYLEFSDQPSDRDRCLTLTLAFIAKIRHPDYPLPVFYRAYWSKKHRQWLPLSIATGGIFNRKCGPLF